MLKATAPTACAGLFLFFVSGCSSDDPEVIAVQNPRSSSYYSSAYGSSYAANRASASSYSPTYVRSAARPSSMSLSSLISEVRLQRDIMPYSCRGRTGKSMSPRYITIHSTQNWSQGADALRHSLALKRSKLGRVSWHFTTDDRRAVQHLPTSEQGNHAENWDGPGNRYSIGIEMCEHPGNSRSATLDRTAKLAAYLMVKHNIPLSRVVPHYKWYRKGHNPPHKNCPHFLMTNGRPGAKWKAFLAKVNRYSIEVRGGQTIYASR